MATSNEAYQINCKDEWNTFYRYWREKPGCIEVVVEDLRAKGHIKASGHESMPRLDDAASEKPQ